MNKKLITISFSFMIMFSFIGMNLYVNSNAYPGYGANEKCNMCHNEPSLVKKVNISFAMNDFATQNAIFNQYAQWSTDEVPVIQTNNRSNANLDFIRMSFLKNATDAMVMAQIPDNTLNQTASATSDKFGIIFNIDVVNFTVGDFLTYYNTTATSLDTVLSGQMAFTNGHADLWYVDMARYNVNSTGMDQDAAISTGILNDGATHQDVHVAIWYGTLGYSLGYRIVFVRPLNTGDPNDAQFNVDGQTIHYAIASWDGSSAVYHLSSFDHMVIVGNKFNLDKTTTNTQTNTQTNTVTSTTTQSGQDHTVTTTVTESGSIGTISTTTSSFTVIFVMIGLMISIPTFSKIRKRKE